MAPSGLMLRLTPLLNAKADALGVDRWFALLKMNSFAVFRDVRCAVGASLVGALFVRGLRRAIKDQKGSMGSKGNYSTVPLRKASPPKTRGQFKVVNIVKNTQIQKCYDFFGIKSKNVMTFSELVRLLCRLLPCTPPPAAPGLLHS